MADGVAITAGSGTTIATDDVTVNGVAGHVQYVKMVDGRANGTDGLPGDSQGQWVVARRDLIRIAVQTSSLTLSVTAYTAGDQVGTLFEFANAARVSGGSGTLVGVTLTDVNDVIGPYDLVLFDSSVTLSGGNNGAFAVSDADSLKLVGIVPMAAYDIGNNRIAQSYNLAIPYVCSGSASLFGGLITRAGHTFFTANTDLQVNLYCERN